MEAGIRLFNTVISTQFCDVDNSVVGLQTPPPTNTNLQKMSTGGGRVFCRGEGQNLKTYATGDKGWTMDTFLAMGKTVARRFFEKKNIHAEVQKYVLQLCT